MTENYVNHYKRWHVPTVAHATEVSIVYEQVLKNRLPENKNSKILDIGCGMGLALWFLQKKGYINCFGIDIDKGQVDAAIKLGVNATWVANTLDYFKDNREFDCVMMLDVLEHVDAGDQIPLLKAISGALRPGGTIVVTVPNADSCIATRWRYIDYTHKMSFTEASLSYLLEAGSFRIQHLGGANIYKVNPKKFRLAGNIFSEICKKAGRFVRRIELIGELGSVEGPQICIDINLIAVATIK
jgi:2-polyprenyl-3-methyl-5-hydroxy-6-metoxy-1,4-benzoquinol methylase